jgi:hypothetical protein
MSMFPTAGAQVYYNEAGEPLGWDAASSYEPEYCDACGGSHSSLDCDDWESDQGDDDDDDDDDVDPGEEEGEEEDDVWANVREIRYGD